MKEYKFNITLSPTEPRPVEPHKLVIPLMGVDAHLVTLKMGHTQVSEDKKWFAEMTVTKGSALSDEFWEANGEKITEYVAQTMSEFIIEKEIPNEQKPINNQFTPEQAGVLDKHIDKFIEQKPAEWSVEDERMRNNLIELLIRLSANTRTDSTSINRSYPREIDWLKSLKPQPKQEWSEEDDLILQQAIYVCHQNGYTAVENWLKSLRPQSKLKS